jgi:hypothetical protein
MLSAYGAYPVFGQWFATAPWFFLPNHSNILANVLPCAILAHDVAILPNNHAIIEGALQRVVVYTITIHTRCFPNWAVVWYKVDTSNLVTSYINVTFDYVHNFPFLGNKKPVLVSRNHLILPDQAGPQHRLLEVSSSGASCQCQGHEALLQAFPV